MPHCPWGEFCPPGVAMASTEGPSPRVMAGLLQTRQPWSCRCRPAGSVPAPDGTAPAHRWPPWASVPLVQGPLCPPTRYLQPLPSSRDSALPVQATTGPRVAHHGAAAERAAGGQGPVVTGTTSGHWGTTSPAPAPPPPLPFPTGPSPLPAPPPPRDGARDGVCSVGSHAAMLVSTHRPSCELLEQQPGDRFRREDEQAAAARRPGRGARLDRLPGPAASSGQGRLLPQSRLCIGQRPAP